MLENPRIPRYLVTSRRDVYHGDNVSGAENQQERLIEFRGWVIGFVDGEGCFSIGFVRQPDRIGRRGYKTGFQVSHEFAVTQGASGVACLESLREFFGVGDVISNRRYDNHREDMRRYVVRRRSDLLETIIPFFRKHPMRSPKQQNFEKFARCVELISSRPAQVDRRSHRDRGDCADHESEETQARAHQNPQRPYARRPRQRMM
jgi:hypothetical protein